jgi:hypothetical protein
MGHAGIQITVETYGRLIPAAGEWYVERLDGKASPPQFATETQPAKEAEDQLSVQAVELIGSGGEDRTPDLGIMRPSLYH